ncbi:MAG TPA: hypothetical protein VHZ95_20830 [Polyangiales bacterium]|nr:hypothetical protein [Polyangiales bacterium]
MTRIHVGEPIGISRDERGGKLDFGNVSGQLQRANLDASQLEMIARSSSVSGATVVYMPE